jgi:hypothetical protein
MTYYDAPNSSTQPMKGKIYRAAGDRLGGGPKENVKMG